MDESKPLETRCTKETPWDKKTLPVLHVDAKFSEDSDSDILVCPNCGHAWSLGPDVMTDDMRKPDERKGP
jgi:uncharacterized protein YbaR (Trm112 family)